MTKPGGLMVLRPELLPPRSSWWTEKAMTKEEWYDRAKDEYVRMANGRMAASLKAGVNTVAW